MAFTKIIIKDRVVIGGQRYTMTQLADGRYEIVPTPDSVTESGTSLNAALLQRYEDNLDDYVNIHKTASNPHNITKDKVNLGNVPNIDATNATNISSGTLNELRLPLISQSKIDGLIGALSSKAPLDDPIFTTKITTPKVIIDGKQISWNEVDGTFDLQLNNGTVLQAGQEVYFFGKALGNISNGQAVQIAGVQGDHILIKAAVTSEINANPRLFIGVATHSFINGTFGYSAWFGYVRGIDTGGLGYPLNQVLYLNTNSGAPDGSMTSTKPSATDGIIEVATVVKLESGAANDGIILVRPSFVSRTKDEIAGLVDDLNDLQVNKLDKSWNYKGYVSNSGNDVDLTGVDFSEIYIKYDGSSRIIYMNYLAKAGGYAHYLVLSASYENIGYGFINYSPSTGVVEVSGHLGTTNVYFDIYVR